MGGLIPPQALEVPTGRTGRVLARFFGPHVSSGKDAHVVLLGCTALLAVATGVLGLLGATWERQALESWINIHALFGLLLCGLVLASFQWRVKHSPPMLPLDVRELSRHLSRIVYLLLYAVLGAREAIVIVHSAWHGGAVDFNMVDALFGRVPDHGWFDPKDDFQLFLASGLLALLFVRLLAIGLWRHSVSRAARSSE